MSTLKHVESLIQEDVGARGLALHAENLISMSKGGLAGAVQSLAGRPKGGVLIFTGFTIPNATPPAPETDGPLGALFLAQALALNGYQVGIATESNCLAALEAGLNFIPLSQGIHLIETSLRVSTNYADDLLGKAQSLLGTITHLVAIEKCGPSHTRESIPTGDLGLFASQTQQEEHGQILTMSARNITRLTSPVHTLFAPAFTKSHSLKTIGIGDGGNEIGMGNIPWRVISQNIQNGARIACSTKVDHLIVAGVSNWGGYALGSLTLLAGKVQIPDSLFDLHEKEAMIAAMVQKGGLIDGRLGISACSVDGLAWSIHRDILRKIRSLVIPK